MARFLGLTLTRRSLRTPPRYAARSPRVLNDLVAEVYTLIANRPTGTGDQQLDLTPPLPAETAFQVVSIHRRFPFIPV